MNINVFKGLSIKNNMRLRLGFVIGYFLATFSIINFEIESTILLGLLLLIVILISYFFDEAFKQEKIKDE